jgi:hypothetical protein
MKLLARAETSSAERCCVLEWERRGMKKLKLLCGLTAIAAVFVLFVLFAEAGVLTKPVRECGAACGCPRLGTASAASLSIDALGPAFGSLRVTRTR